jgi:hypothetical protein
MCFYPSKDWVAYSAGYILLIFYVRYPIPDTTIDHSHSRWQRNFEIHLIILDAHPNPKY